MSTPTPNAAELAERLAKSLQFLRIVTDEFTLKQIKVLAGDMLKPQAARIAELEANWAGAADTASLLHKQVAALEAALAQQVPAVPGWRLVPVEPTHAMVSAMACSKAKDAEGEFPALLDLIDYSGENKTHTVLIAAFLAALAAAPLPTPEKPA